VAGINVSSTSAAIAFEDSADISEYAKEAVSAIQQAGIINGMPGGRFAPKDTANRAQSAVIIYKLIDEL
jgi:endo-1,4-beta-xylanase